MKPRLTFVVSICLNLALGSVAVWLWEKTVVTETQLAAKDIFRTEQVEVTDASITASDLPINKATAGVTNHFDWNTAESDDWEKLAANLRAVRCPEKTVRDLLLARARRALDQIERDQSPQSFWIAGLRQEREAAERDRTRGVAREKIRTAWQRAAGVDSDPREARTLRDFEEQALTRFIIGPMPEERFQKLVATLNRFEERIRAAQQRTLGVQLDEDLAELKQLDAQFVREATALLTREEFEEYAARCAMMRSANDVKWEATDLTTAEVRQLALIRARFQGPTTDLLGGSRSTTDEQDEQIRATTRAFLGERRAAEMERAADGDFQRLFDLGNDHHLSRDAVVKAYDLHQFAAQEAGQLREDRSLSDAQRRQRLEQMRAETQEAILNTLGAAACQEYLRHGGEWVTNFTRL